jgi:hypothetical protein
MRRQRSPSLDRREIISLAHGNTRESGRLRQECARLAQIDSALISGSRVRRTVLFTVRVLVSLNLTRFKDLDASWNERKNGPKSGSRTVATPLARVARIPPGPGVATVLLSETLAFIEERTAGIITKFLRRSRVNLPRFTHCPRVTRADVTFSCAGFLPRSTRMPCRN